LNTQTSDTALAPQEQRTGMMLAHLLGILGILGAVIYWLIKKDKNEEPFVQDQAKEVLNLELNILIIGIAVGIIASITGISILSLAVSVLNLVLCILGALKANGGVLHRYPVIIRLLK